MTSKFLPIVAKNALLEGAELLPQVRYHRGGQREALRLCSTLRRRGICELFLLAAVDRLHLYLCKSGRVFLHFLEGARRDALVKSKAEPFFDALACVDMDCARRLALHARAPWNEELEYAEDYLYVDFLMSMVLGAETERLLGTTLARFEELSPKDPRLGVCKALLSRDHSAFDEELSRLIEERNLQYRKRAERGAVLEEELATDGQLLVEGLALVQLAEGMGFRLPDDYMHIPSLARRQSAQPPAPESWWDITE